MESRRVIVTVRDGGRNASSSLSKLRCDLPRRQSQARPETVDQCITCRVCNGPFPSREKNLILKYFLLREGGHRTSRRTRNTKLASGIIKSGQ
jgi:hypothetical protein